MPKSRAVKEMLIESKPKSIKEMLKEAHRSGKEDMIYGKEMMIKGKMKMIGAKMMMNDKSIAHKLGFKKEKYASKI